MGVKPEVGERSMGADRLVPAGLQLFLLCTNLRIPAREPERPSVDIFGGILIFSALCGGRPGGLRQGRPFEGRQGNAASPISRAQGVD